MFMDTTRDLSNLTDDGLERLVKLTSGDAIFKDSIIESYYGIARALKAALSEHSEGLNSDAFTNYLEIETINSIVENLKKVGAEITRFERSKRESDEKLERLKEELEKRGKEDEKV